jgi:hypothetical protein
MSELIPVFAIVALTIIVLAGLLAIFREYVVLRERLMAAYEPAERHAPAGAAKHDEAHREPAPTDVRLAA